jgi:hypothetical protein
MFAELEVVVVRALLVPTRAVSGTEGCVRQPNLGDEGTIVHVLGPRDFIVECVDPGTGYTLWIADFKDMELTAPPRGWLFSLSEVSAGVYRAAGDGPRGLHVESTDDDATRATANCRAFAIQHPE